VSIIILFAVFFGLVIFQVPVIAAMLLAALSVTWIDGLPTSIVAQRIAPSLESFPFLAIPLFVFGGNLLNRSGIASRIFAFSKALAGHIRGGLAHVNIIGSIIFAGMSGVAQADAAGLGQIEVKEMKRAGYTAEFACAVSAASAVIGPVIPPSVIMVIYGVLTGVSVADLFIAGIIPGLLLGVALMVTVYLLSFSPRIPMPLMPRLGWRDRGVAFVKAIPGLAAPAALLSGLLTGAATPTELGALIVAYAILLGFIQRELTLRELFVAAYETVVICGVACCRFRGHWVRLIQPSFRTRRG
jgi:tripartite ATP-independent transporter DctM subunit